MKFFKKKWKKKEWVLVTLASTAIFIIAFTTSYYIFGSTFSWTKPLWKNVFGVFQFPVASVNGYEIDRRIYETAKRLGAPDSIKFVVRSAAIVVLAKEKNIRVSKAEVDKEFSDLLFLWGLTENELNTKLKEADVDRNDFLELYIENEILADKLATNLNAPGATVEEVETNLKQGQSFDDLAVKYSQDYVSAVLGGDIGFVNEHEIDNLIWQSAVNLSDGNWAGPINTPQGYVFVKRLERQRGENNQPDNFHLKLILIKSFNFEQWLSGQLEQMKVQIYI